MEQLTEQYLSEVLESLNQRRPEIKEHLKEIRPDWFSDSKDLNLKFEKLEKFIKVHGRMPVHRGSEVPLARFCQKIRQMTKRFNAIKSGYNIKTKSFRGQIRDGLDRARAEGKTLGRPKIDIDMEQLIKYSHSGLSTRKIAYRMNMSKSTVAEILKNLKEKNAS